MNFTKIFTREKIKKTYLGAIMSLFFLTITMVPGATNVHADTWSVKLPVACAPGLGRQYTRGSATAKMSLTRIVNGPCYYVTGQMVTVYNEPRTNRMLVKQGAGYKNFSNVSMKRGGRYHLVVRSTCFETTSRSAYGYIQV